MMISGEVPDSVRDAIEQTKHLDVASMSVEQLLFAAQFGSAESVVEYNRRMALIGGPVYRPAGQ
jgi:hypothetical protein